VLTEQMTGAEAVLKTGRLQKIDENVDALVRSTFLDGNLPPYQAILARRFRGLSQNEEDGITLALFDRLGTSTRRFVEIGAGVNGGNSGFLAKECGWTGLMIEVDPDRVATLQRRFGSGVCVRQAQVTRENVNELLKEHGGDGDVDLLSIDIDGNDYWVWESLTACRPRLVIVEYNPYLGVDRPVVIPYDSQFNRHRFDVPRAAYHGASLPALMRLGERKGYRAIIVEPRGVNAFFVRNDLGEGLPSLRIGDIRPASDALMDFGPGGIFSFFERAGLPVLDIQ
jgi:hypothetical protein